LIVRLNPNSFMSHLRLKIITVPEENYMLEKFEGVVKNLSE